MTAAAIGLLVVSALIHAAWNVLSKSRNPSLSFFLTAVGAGGIPLFFLPVVFRHQIAAFPPAVWACLAVSGFFMAVYYTGLAGAYRTGDISMAYPLARSSPILVVTFVSVVLGRGHEIGIPAVAGTVLVVAGCFLLPMKRFRDFHISNYRTLCCLLAALAAIGTAGYTIVDDRAMRTLKAAAAGQFPIRALLYMALEFVSACFWMLLAVLTIRTERRAAGQVVRTQARPAFLAGLGIWSAYALVLISMTLVSNVSYVAAFRQLSILLGSAWGIWVLKEPAFPPRVAGIAAIFTGLILVTVG